MPQFDTSQYPSIIFWMLVNCALLIGVFVGYYLPKFGRILSRRKDKINEGIENNNFLRSQVEILEKDYLHDLAEAQKEATAIILENKDSARNRYKNQLYVLDEEFRSEMKALSAIYQSKQKELEDDLDNITDEALRLIENKLLKG